MNDSNEELMLIMVQMNLTREDVARHLGDVSASLVARWCAGYKSSAFAPMPDHILLRLRRSITFHRPYATHLAIAHN